MTPAGTVIPVISSRAHLGHSGLREVEAGREVACYEVPERVAAIERALHAEPGCVLSEPDPFGMEPILAVHDPALVEVVERAWTDALAAGDADGTRPLIPDTFLLAAYPGPMSPARLPTAAHRRLGAFCFDTATPIVAGTAAAARGAVEVALTAARRVLDGAPLAVGLCRPPGHHAGRALLGGYCFYNNAAVVAEWLRSVAGRRRVAIVDIDYHHGNGTQQIFWERGDVLYVSLHGDPALAYPYFSGHSSERGAGDGEGATFNLPLPAGTDGDAYAAALHTALNRVAAFGPDAPLILSLGFDTFVDDPLGDFGLVTNDYGRLGRMIADLGMPTIVLLEGGYAVEALGANALTFLGGASGAAGASADAGGV